MTAATLGSVAGGLGADRRADLAAVLALMVGVFCVVGGLARLGFLPADNADIALRQAERNL